MYPPYDDQQYGTSPMNNYGLLLPMVIMTTELLPRYDDQQYGIPPMFQLRNPPWNNYGTPPDGNYDYGTPPYDVPHYGYPLRMITELLPMVIMTTELHRMMFHSMDIRL